MFAPFGLLAIQAPILRKSAVYFMLYLMLEFKYTISYDVVNITNKGTFL